MSATAEAPERPRLTREQAADRLLEYLTDEPQSAAGLRRKVLGPGVNAGGSDSALVRNGLDVLEARHQATRIPNRGWTRYDSTQANGSQPLKVEFQGKWSMIAVDEMFIDQDYQRPLTSFVQKIERKFDPLLFQLLALSDRGAKHKPKRYAIIDGQTRWTAATRRHIPSVPCVIYEGLTPQDEADLFAKLQKERRGMATWHRFRAALAARNEEALSIKDLVEATGFQIGDQQGKIKAIAALEATYRRDPILLERTLFALNAAWPERTPEDIHIRGLHRFYRDYPVGEKKTKKTKGMKVDDGLLVRRLKSTGPDGLERKMSAVKEAGIVGKGGRDKFMSYAIQNAYSSR